MTGVRPWPADLDRLTGGSTPEGGSHPVLQIVDVTSRTVLRTIALPDQIAMDSGIGGGPAGSTPYRVHGREIIAMSSCAGSKRSSSMPIRDTSLPNSTIPIRSLNGQVRRVSLPCRRRQLYKSRHPFGGVVTIDRVDITSHERTTILSADRAAELGLGRGNRTPYLALSTSGQRLAIAGLDSTGRRSSLLLYDLVDGDRFDPFKPAARYNLDFLPMAIDWAPGDDAIVVAAVAGSQADVRVLDISRGTWTIVGVIGKGQVLRS